MNTDSGPKENPARDDIFVEKSATPSDFLFSSGAARTCGMEKIGNHLSFHGDAKSEAAPPKTKRKNCFVSQFYKDATRYGVFDLTAKSTCSHCKVSRIFGNGMPNPI